MVILASTFEALRFVKDRRNGPTNNALSWIIQLMMNCCVRWPLLIAGLFALLLVTPSLYAHESIGSISNTLVTVDGNRVDYYLNVPVALKSLMFSTSEHDWYRDYFADTIKLRSGETDCRLYAMSPFATQKSGNEIVHLNYRCEQPVQSLSISSEAFLDLDDKHVQMLKLVKAGDLRTVLNEGMFNSKQREMRIANVHGVSSLLLNRIWRFLKIGVEHIITGYDHILFVISVILITTGLRDALKVVTAFTVAHSITLALAFFGLVSLPASIVEPLIALTIVYVAFENIVLRRYSKRWLLVFLFGLVHGLGFVGVLKDITMSRDELVSALLAFNLGIEFGQILIVVPLLLMLRSIREHNWQPQVIRYASLSMGIMGLVWFIDRVPFGSLFDMVRGSA